LGPITWKRMTGEMLYQCMWVGPCITFPLTQQLHCAANCSRMQATEPPAIHVHQCRWSPALMHVYSRWLICLHTASVDVTTTRTVDLPTCTAHAGGVPLLGPVTRKRMTVEMLPVHVGRSLYHLPFDAAAALCCKL